MGQRVELARRTAEGGCLYVSCGAAGETKVPRVARNDSGNGSARRLKPSFYFCHPELSISFANAKVTRSRRSPVVLAAHEPRRGILIMLSSERCGVHRENSLRRHGKLPAASGSLRLRSGQALRLRNCFASRSSYSAQDDKWICTIRRRALAISFRRPRRKFISRRNQQLQPSRSLRSQSVISKSLDRRVVAFHN